MGSSRYEMLNLRKGTTFFRDLQILCTFFSVQWEIRYRKVPAVNRLARGER